MILLNKVIERLDHSRLIILISAVLLYSLLVYSIAFQRGGVLYSESQTFILNYLDHRSFWQKIFAVNLNDWGFYQARELSYFFDFIDANFINLFIKIGLPHFYSLTYYVGLLIIIILTPILLERFFKLKSVTTNTLLIGLFLTSPITFFSGSFFRSSKILVSVFILLISLLIFELLGAKSRKKRLLIGAGLMVASLAMALSDRQGHFFLLSLTLIFLLLTLLLRHRRYFNIFLIFLLTTIVATIYDYYLGIFIIHKITGFNLDATSLSFDFMTYTHQDPRITIPDFWLKIWSFVVDAVVLLADTFAYLFGNLNTWLIVPIIACFTFVAFKDNQKNKSQKVIYLIIALCAILLIFMLFYMILKNPPIIRPGIRRIYYTLPVGLLFPKKAR